MDVLILYYLNLKMGIEIAGIQILLFTKVKTIWFNTVSSFAFTRLEDVLFINKSEV